jgi:hypothetical protein
VAHPARPQASTTGYSRSLFVAAGLLVIFSVLLYAVGVYGVAEVSFADDWYHNLIWVAQLVAAGLLLTTRATGWGGLLLGILAWAWVDLAPILHSGAQDYFQNAWGFLVMADVTAIAAQVCLVVALVRDRGTEAAPITRARVVTAALLACLATGTSLLLAPLLFEAWSLDTAEGAAVRAITAVACAAVIPATILVVPSRRVGPLVPLGWFLGGAELAIFTVWINLSGDGIFDTNRDKFIWLCTLLILTAAAATTSSARLRSAELRGAP